MDDWLNGTNITTTATATDDDALSSACPAHDSTNALFRLVLNAVVGGSISVLSILENGFLLALFASRQQHRHTYTVYLMVLAFFDIFMSVSFILLMSTRAVFTYYESYEIKKLWTSYVVVMIAISHIAMTSSAFLITFAAVERYCITVQSSLMKPLHRHRLIFVLVAVLIGIATKVSFLVEIEVKHFAECVGTLSEWMLMPSALATNELFKIYFRFHLRNILTIFTPFAVLLLLNILLVNRLRTTNHQTSLDKQSIVMQKERIRAITRSLIVLVATYLMSNVVSVFVTVWENIDQMGLFNNHLTFYMFTVDLVSLLTVAACALRLPIYAICQPQLRAEMIHFLSVITPFCSVRPFDDKRRNTETEVDEAFVRALNAASAGITALPSSIEHDEEAREDSILV